MLETPTSETADRPFVYVSAEDIFRPFVPDGYIRTKRQAEQAILRLCADSAEREHKGGDGGVVRPVLVRPGGSSRFALSGGYTDTFCRAHVSSP